MNVDIERGLKLRDKAEQEQEAIGDNNMVQNILGELMNNSSAENLDEKEQFSQLLDLLGVMGGYDKNTFAEEKEAILNSGISLEDFSTILEESMVDKLGPREIVDVHIQTLTPTAKTPEYAHMSDACADIYADETITIQPGETVLVSTGIALAVPMGYVVHIYPRSSIGAKTPLRLSNSVGVIDSEYRDEIKVIYTNIGTEEYTIQKGDRIAQMSIDAAPMARFHRVPDIKEVGEDRGGGIGSTGGLAENEEKQPEN